MDVVERENRKKWLKGSLKVLTILVILGGIVAALYFVFEKDTESKTTTSATTVETSTSKPTSTAASTSSSSKTTSTSQEECSDGHLRTIIGGQCEQFDKTNCCGNMTIKSTANQIQTGNSYFDSWSEQEYTHIFILDGTIWYDRTIGIENTYDILTWYYESNKKESWKIIRALSTGGSVTITELPNTYKGCPSETDYYVPVGTNDWEVTCHY